MPRYVHDRVGGLMQSHTQQHAGNVMFTTFCDALALQDGDCDYGRHQYHPMHIEQLSCSNRYFDICLESCICQNTSTQQAVGRRSVPTRYGALAAFMAAWLSG